MSGLVRFAAKAAGKALVLAGLALVESGLAEKLLRRALKSRNAAHRPALGWKGKLRQAFSRQIGRRQNPRRRVL